MDPERSTLKQLFDPVSLDMLRELQEEGEPDILGELVELFETESQERLTALQQAVRDARADEVTRAAHALAGSSAVFGAESMVTLCRDLQAVGRSGDLREAPAQVAQLLREYERLRTALQHEVAQGS